MKRDGLIEVMIGGPTVRANRVEYEAGTEGLGIRFRVGTFMAHLPLNRLMYEPYILPQVTRRAFWLSGSAWELPDYENVEGFVDRLVRKDLLLSDEVVDTILEGKPVALSERSVQRHFLRTTGLTHNFIRQIERASLAADLLRQRIPLSTVAYQTGYADQAHMTGSLKYLIGYTPAQVVHTDRS